MTFQKDWEEVIQKPNEKFWIQEKRADEVIQITYSFWDGSGHRRHVQMKKGNIIHEFLQKCLENLRN
uniref:FAM50A/XAP5 C-terminal domain-containing protein n=1 Tax=Amphimedon queenslandica TaxID=400682 RepID=A0A1X7TG85_AMPQE